MRDLLTLKDGSKPVGAYSLGVWTGKTLYMSGILGITDELVKSHDIKKETSNAMNQAILLLESQGLTLENVVKATIYLSNMEKFLEFDETYKGFFKNSYPARATVEVSKLAINANIEIVLTAYDENR